MDRLDGIIHESTFNSPVEIETIDGEVINVTNRIDEAMIQVLDDMKTLKIADHMKVSYKTPKDIKDLTDSYVNLTNVLSELANIKLKLEKY